MTSQIKEIDAGSALRALLKAIAPQDSAEFDQKSLTSDDVKRITQKIGSIVGANGEEGSGMVENKALNEEGLPIVDILEPAIQSVQGASDKEEHPIIDQELTPIFDLPLEQQERRKQERRRVLAMLAQEEREELAQHRRRAIEHNQETLRQRKEETEKEAKRVQEARAVRKKMGKAFVQSLEASKDDSEKKRTDPEEFPPVSGAETKKGEKKKVTFAENQEEELPLPKKEQNWGDISLARLKYKSRIPSMTNALADKLPMKMNVVERVPGGHAPIVTQTAPICDSDDESEPPSSPASEPEDKVEEPPDAESDSESINEPIKEIDFFNAQHQREVALEYYRQRSKIGAATAEVLQSQFKDDESMTKAPVGDSAKPVISQFRASRLTSAFNASTSKAQQNIENITVPVAGVKTLQHAFRTGKINEKGQLVGSENSDTDEDLEGKAELLELLQKGEIYNVGPKGNEFLHAVPPNVSTTGSRPPPTRELRNRVETKLPPPKKTNPSVSKFKASRVQAGRPSTPPVTTPISSIQKSAPSAASMPNCTPISQKVLERNPASATSTDGPKTLCLGVQSSTTKIFTVPVMVAETPSFHHPSGIRLATKDPAPQPGTIIESTSFQPPKGSHNTSRVMASMVVESPSFPRAPKLPIVSNDVATTVPPGTTTLSPVMATMVESPTLPHQSSGRSEWPPTVVAARVVGAHAREQLPTTGVEDNQLKRVSRFMAGRK